MIEAMLLNQPVAAVVLAMAAMTLDHFTAAYEARLYHAGVKDFVVYEGLYQRVVTGRRFAVSLAVLGAAVGTAWWLLIRQVDRADVFLILMGGLLLTPLADVLMQYRNILFFREVQRRGGLSGRVIHTRRTALMQRVYEQSTFVILYALLFVLVGSWFFLGGAAACFVNSRRLRDWTIVKA